VVDNHLALLQGPDAASQALNRAYLNNSLAPGDVHSSILMFGLPMAPDDMGDAIVVRAQRAESQY
jgi:hypothetical protein